MSPKHNQLNTELNEPNSFDHFWSVYPKRVAKAAAVKAWKHATKRATPERIIAGATAYRDDPGRDPNYTAHPATWLNADRWDDEPTAPKVTKPKGLAVLERMMGSDPA